MTKRALTLEQRIRRQLVRVIEDESIKPADRLKAIDLFCKHFAEPRRDDPEENRLKEAENRLRGLQLRLEAGIYRLRKLLRLESEGLEPSPGEKPLSADGSKDQEKPANF